MTWWQGAGSAGPDDMVRGFARGLVQPSRLAVATALMVLAAVFAAYCLVFGPRFAGSDLYRYLMDDAHDAQTHVTHKVLSQGDGPRPRIIVLGNSITIRCIAPDGTFSAMVGERLGTRIPALNLASDAQSTWEMAAIMDRIPPGDGGVLVLGLAPGVLRIPPDGEHRSSLQAIMKWPKLGFTSAAVDEEARRLGIEPPLRTGIHAIDNYGFVLARRKSIVRNLLRGAPVPADPLTAPWYDHVNRPEYWAKEIEDLDRVVRNYDANAAVNFDVLERLVARAREAGDVSVVVLESPVNPKWQDVPAGKRFFQRYRADLAALAERLDARLLLATEAASLKASDFVDYEGHLGNAEARARCTGALAGTIADLLEEE